jgi:hypothetical protein
MNPIETLTLSRRVFRAGVAPPCEFRLSVLSHLRPLLNGAYNAVYRAGLITADVPAAAAGVRYDGRVFRGAARLLSHAGLEGDDRDH